MSKQYELKGLNEKRAKIVAEVTKIGANVRKEERAMSAEEKTAFEKLQTDFAAVNDAIAAVKADLDAIAAIEGAEPAPEPERSRPAPARRSGTVAGGIIARGGDSFGMVRESPEEAAKTRATVFKAWCRTQYDLEPTEEQEAACERMGTTPDRLRQQKDFVFRLDPTPRRQYRDMSAGTGSAGGFFVPQGFSNEFERFLLATSPLRQVARVIRTDSGNTMPYPTVSDTGNLGELLAENATVATVDPTIGQVNFAAYKYGSRLIPVSFELMNDSAFDMESLVGELAGERIGRSQNAAFTTGTGTAQPQGVVTGATAGITTASATAIAASEVIRLAHAIDPAYRDSPNIAYMMHDNIKLQLALLVDSQNRPLFVASYRDGEVDKVYGRPVYANQGMAASIVTTAITMLYGDFSKFIIRDAGEVRMRRLDERYADKDQTGFVAFLRSDSRVINTNAIKRLTQA